MGYLIYKKSIKRTLLILEILLAGILAFSILNIGFWMEDSYSISELSKSYEQTDLFFRQVDEILKHKIQGQLNLQLFETDGVFDEDLQIDIQSYGTIGNAVQDMNTTYRLSELLKFAEDGSRNLLHDALDEAIAQQDQRGMAPGELLAEQSEKLETILPVTGISLSECSRWFSDPAEFVLKSYRKLDEVSQSIYDRYLVYKNEQDESWSSGAPSNLRYCIENTATGELFTNTIAPDYKTAVAMLQKDERWTRLYEGERSFNMMVTNPENALSEEAAGWFMQERFSGTNERVYLAFDSMYPVSDELRTYADIFEKRESIVGASIVCVVICLLLIILGMVCLTLGAGWQEGKVTPQPGILDQIPTELAFSIFLAVTLVYVIYFRDHIVVPGEIIGIHRIYLSVVAGTFWLVVMGVWLSLIRRIRTRSLWSNSICLMLIRTWRQVNSARTASGQFLFLYIIFVLLNLVFQLLGSTGVVFTLILDLVVLLYLLRDTVGKQSVYAGIHQISKGDLSYKIDTTALQGETFEMARAVNEMGDGLQEAVDAIVKNERLKAELITNVSHDIKTPLTSIVNYVDLLKRENLPGDRVKKYIEILEQKSQRLRQLTEDLVEASKITSGNIELQLMKLPLQGMLQQACGEFQERFEEKELIPVMSIEKEPAYIMADGRQLWRILENLLGNIYKYAANGTRLYIELYREDRTVFLSLQNTSKDELTIDGEELMGRFVRGDMSRNTEGSGLGLSIAKSLMQLHGGTFEIHTEADTFKAIISFPVVVDEI